MSRCEGVVAYCLLTMLVAPACSESEPPGPAFSYPSAYDLGDPIDETTSLALRTTIPPDGAGIPEGSGTFDTGAEIYLNRCAACHGVDLSGTSAGPPLLGGRDSLRSDSPTKTVESFWPYATSVFSYIRNTMPVAEPGSLSNDEVYALMAFILGSADIVPTDVTMTPQTLVDTQMPNRDGFVRDDRPDVETGNVSD